MTTERQSGLANLHDVQVDPNCILQYWFSSWCVRCDWSANDIVVSSQSVDTKTPYSVLEKAQEFIFLCIVAHACMYYVFLY